MLLIEELYDALIDAGAGDDKARAASRAVARYEEQLSDIRSTLRLHGWMLATLVTITLMTLGGTLAVLYRLSGR